MNYKVVIIDLDNTLLDFDAMEQGSLKDTLSIFGVQPSEKLIGDYVEINHQLWGELEKGQYTKVEILTKRFEILFKKHDIELNANLVNETYLNNMSNHLFMMDYAYEILEYLKEKVVVVCMTNGVQSAQEAKFKKAGLYPFFDHIIISDVVGFHKPDVRIFDYMANQIGSYKKEDMIIIGDSLSSDIRGGNQFGIATVWYNPKHMANNLEPVTYEIDSLSQLFEIL